MHAEDAERSGKIEYVYSSSELSKFYGLTIKGMAYYEQCGLVTPERVGLDKVRRYSLLDNYRLFYTRFYKNMGLSIRETADLLENNTPEHLAGDLDGHISRLRREVWFQRRMLEELERLRRLLPGAAGEPSFSVICEEEGFYRLFIRPFSGPHKSSREETLEYKTWNDYLPVANASLRFPLADCLSDREELDTEIGLILREGDFRAIGLQESGRTQYIPAGRFLHTFLCGEAERLDRKDWLRPALTWMQAHRLRQTGDAFTKMIMVLRQDGRDLRCDEAWFPVYGE